MVRAVDCYMRLSVRNRARGEIPPLLPDSREGDVKELDSLMYQTVMRRA